MNSQAEEDITQAKKAYSGKDVTSFSQENNIAFTDLFDIQYQASISDCSFAENQEWDTAAQLIQDYHQHYHRDLLSGPNAEQEATNARKALLSTCRVPPGTLKANNILTLISP